MFVFLVTIVCSMVMYAAPEVPDLFMEDKHLKVPGF